MRTLLESRGSGFILGMSLSSRLIWLLCKPVVLCALGFRRLMVLFIFEHTISYMCAARKTRQISVESVALGYLIQVYIFINAGR